MIIKDIDQTILPFYRHTPMKYILPILMLFFLAVPDMKSQSYSEIDRETLLEITGRNTDSTYVINFWATWCSPCVKEIPYFQELYMSKKNEKIRIILVSLDFPRQAATRLPAFLEEKGITAEVRLMTDHNYNEWIDLVDPSWSGAIPATLIYNGDKRVFLEKELEKEELFNTVNQIHN